MQSPKSPVASKSSNSGSGENEKNVKVMEALAKISERYNGDIVKGLYQTFSQPVLGEVAISLERMTAQNKREYALLADVVDIRERYTEKLQSDNDRL